MKMTINDKEYEIYIGDRDGHFEECRGGGVATEWVVDEDKELDKFIEAIGEMKGQLFVNYAFSDDTTHYYGGDMPCYYINGYKDDWSDTSFDRTLEQVKEELLKHDNVKAVFVGQDERQIMYVGEDGHFCLSSVWGQIGDILGWSE